MEETNRGSCKPLNELLCCKTPLWTGNINSPNTEMFIKESGLVGSLRWWTEAVLRSLGYFVCDPTGSGNEDRCPQTVGNETYYCAGCHIFGATGWRRRFRIEASAEDITSKPQWIQVKPQGRTHGWRLYSGISNDFYLKVIPLHSEFDPILLEVPLALAITWGGIGAKTRLGYGVFEFKQEPVGLLDIVDRLIAYFESRSLRTSQNQADHPNLKDMFFSKIQFEAERNAMFELVRDSVRPEDRAKLNSFLTSPPLTPLIKNWLRFGPGRELWTQAEMSPSQNRKIEEWLFGFVSKADRQAGKINISWPYQTVDGKWELRLWGYLPNYSIFSRLHFLENLQNHLNSSTGLILGIIDASMRIGPVEWVECLPGESGANYLRRLLFSATREGRPGV